MPDLTISTPVDNLVSCADAAAMRTVLGLGTAATATLASLLSDFTYTAATRILSSASTGASATLTLADGTNPGLMASADYTLLNTITTKRLLGRNTGSTGAGEQVTADQLLDWVTGSVANGDMLYRGSTAYARLAASGAVAGSLLYMDTAVPAPTWSTKWSVNSSGTLTGATGSLTGSSTPALAITQTWNNVATTFTGASLTITDTTSAAGSVLFTVATSSSADWLTIKKENDIGNSTAGRCHLYSRMFAIKSFYGSAFIMNGVDANNGLKIGPNTAGYLDIGQVNLAYISPRGFSYITNDGHDLWAIRNSTTAQSFAIYNTYTSSSNYERLRIYGTAAASFTIAAERDATPTGSYRGINIATGGSTQIAIGTDGMATFTGQGTALALGNCAVVLSSSANVALSLDSGASSSPVIRFGQGGTRRMEWGYSGPSSLGYIYVNANQPLVFGTNDVERLRITAAGNIHSATTSSTSMANGFIYVSSAAGTPTASPPTAITGQVPLYYDTTNNKLYVYNGAWKSVTLA